MPKIKNKSGAKKRLNKFIRNARGTAILAKADEKIIKRNFLRT